MAFFTRMNLNVPVLPPEELGTEGTCSVASSHMHRKYASEPAVTSVHNFMNSSTTQPNNVPGGSALPTKSADRNAANVVAMVVNEDEVALSNADGKSVNAKGRPAATETGARNSQNGERETLSKSAEKNGNGEPKRYEYVVDRVLGVEV